MTQCKIESVIPVEFITVKALAGMLAEAGERFNTLLVGMGPRDAPFLEEIDGEAERVLEELLGPANSLATKTIAAGLILCALCQVVATVADEKELFKVMPLEERPRNEAGTA